MNIETANRLVQYRKARGLSQESLADSLGISRQAVSKWERAEASPDTDNLLALARLYGVSLDELLDNRPGPQTAPQAADGEDFAPITSEPAPKPKFDDAIEQWVEDELLEAIQDTGKSKRKDEDDDEDDRHNLLGRLSPGARKLLGILAAAGFVVFAIVYGLLSLLFPNLSDIYPIICVIFFMAGGALFNWWHPGWMVFLSIPIFYTIFGG